jgi:predicted phosphodiesterase
MRVLLLSDIHSNRVALETILSNAPAFDAVWCLGDVVGYGPMPNECVARLRGLHALTLTGNHDQAVLGNVPLETFRDTARQALEWTRRVLTQESLEWLAARPSHLVLPEHDMTLVHASPREPVWEYIENARTALENFSFFETAYCWFGHTHQPIAYRLRTRDRVLSTHFLPENKPYLLEPRLLVNPGSVGQPRDGDSRAAFGILDLDTQVLVHHRVEYDIPAVQRAMMDAHLPYRLVARLAQGA